MYKILNRKFHFTEQQGTHGLMSGAKQSFLVLDGNNLFLRAADRKIINLKMGFESRLSSGIIIRKLGRVTRGKFLPGCYTRIE